MSYQSIDEKDKEILDMLMTNAKVSAKDISTKLEAPITTIYSRIKRLEDVGIIKGYKPILDAAKLGRPTTAFIFAQFSYRPPGVDKDLDQRQCAKEVARFPEVQEIHIITGDWDFLIKVRDKDVASIGRFVVDKLRTVKGISKTLTCMVFDSLKETQDIPL